MLHMQEAFLELTFKQEATEYWRRVHIDCVRVDEVKLRAPRSDGVFSICSLDIA